MRKLAHISVAAHFLPQIDSQLSWDAQFTEHTDANSPPIPFQHPDTSLPTPLCPCLSRSKLEDGEEEEKDDTRANVFDLKGSKLDNLFYFHYGARSPLPTSNLQQAADVLVPYGVSGSRIA